MARLTNRQTLWNLTKKEIRSKFCQRYSKWFVVYKLTNITNEKSYIGQSISFESRIKNHICEGKSSEKPLYRAIRKAGLENFTLEVLFRTKNKRTLDKKEQEFIKAFESNTQDKGYNLTLGGQSWISRNDYKSNYKNHLMYVKPCWLFNLEGSLYKKFETLKECSIEIGLSSGQMRDAYHKGSIVKHKWIVAQTDAFPGYKKKNLGIKKETLKRLWQD